MEDSALDYYAAGAALLTKVANSPKNPDGHEYKIVGFDGTEYTGNAARELVNRELGEVKGTRNAVIRMSDEFRPKGSREASALSTGTGALTGGLLLNALGKKSPVALGLGAIGGAVAGNLAHRGMVKLDQSRHDARAKDIQAGHDNWLRHQIEGSDMALKRLDPGHPGVTYDYASSASPTSGVAYARTYRTDGK